MWCEVRAILRLARIVPANAQGEEGTGHGGDEPGDVSRHACDKGEGYGKGDQHVPCDADGDWGELV